MHPDYRRFTGWGQDRDSNRYPRHLDVSPGDEEGIPLTVIGHNEIGLGRVVLPALQAQLLGAHLLRPLADDLRRILPLLPSVPGREMSPEDLAALRRLRILAGLE